MQIVNIADLREAARRRLPRIIFEYLEGGAEDEITLRRNCDAFAQRTFVPSALPGADQCDSRVTLFGDTLEVPWIVGPTGLNSIFWHGADLAIARAAERIGAVYAHPTAANVAMEDAAAATTGIKWFQLYPWGERRVWQRLVERAQGAGFRALIVTVDTMVAGNRERDRRNRFAHGVQYTPSSIFDGLTHPRWLAGVWLRGGTPRLANLAEFAPASASATEIADHVKRMRNPRVTWDDIAWIRSLWHGPLLVKGLLSASDALRAAELGAEGVIVSNHGGRQLDGAIATLDALPPIVDAVGARVTVLIDGGLRRGSDIVKALAVGAKGVLLGRAPLYGLAAMGEPGVNLAMDILRDELHRTLHLLGCPHVAGLSAERLREVRRE